MKRCRFNVGIIALTLFFSINSSVSAQGLSIQPRATIGYQYYEFDGEEDGVGNAIGDIDYKTDYLLGGLGATVQYNRFFADFYGQTNLSDANDNVDDLSGIDGLDSAAEIDRYELNLALGYAIIPKLTVSGGVKYARTKIDSDLSGAIDGVAVEDGSTLDLDVEYVGPFFGAAFALPVADLGSAVFSGSVAYLFGNAEADLLLNGDASAVDVNGESIGANIGLAWAGGLGPLSSALSGVGYSFGIDYSAYEFKDDGVDEFKEKTVRGRFDLKYRF